MTWLLQAFVSVSLLHGALLWEITVFWAYTALWWSQVFSEEAELKPVAHTERTPLSVKVSLVTPDGCTAGPAGSAPRQPNLSGHMGRVQKHTVLEELLAPQPMRPAGGRDSCLCQQMVLKADHVSYHGLGCILHGLGDGFGEQIQFSKRKWGGLWETWFLLPPWLIPAYLCSARVTRPLNMVWFSWHSSQDFCNGLFESSLTAAFSK